MVERRLVVARRLALLRERDVDVDVRRFEALDFAFGFRVAIVAVMACSQFLHVPGVRDPIDARVRFPNTDRTSAEYFSFAG